MMYGVTATGATGSSVVMSTDHTHSYHHHPHAQHNGQTSYENGYPDCTFYYPNHHPGSTTYPPSTGDTPDFLISSDQHNQPPSIKTESFCPPPLVYNHVHHHHSHHQYEMSSPEIVYSNYNPAAPTGL